MDRGMSRSRTEAVTDVGAGEELTGITVSHADGKERGGCDDTEEKDSDPGRAG